jgi:hypothetical protein
MQFEQEQREVKKEERHVWFCVGSHIQGLWAHLIKAFVYAVQTTRSRVVGQQM